MKKQILKRIMLLGGVIAFFTGCPEKIYDAPKPVVEVGEEICFIDCVKSSTATKTEWTVEDFTENVLKNSKYLSVVSAHALHDSQIGFVFEPALNKINIGHQHGKQTIPFLVKDSAGVWAESSIDVMVVHDQTAPKVTPPASLGEIPYGEAVSTSILADKILEQGTFEVELNPCAASASKKVTFVDWVYENNVEENQTYPVKFKVKDALGNISEEKETQFRYGQNTTGAPRVVQLQNIVLDCTTITAENIRTKLDDPAFFTVNLSPGRDLVRPISLQGLDHIIVNTHYHNPHLEVIATFVDSTGAKTAKAINVVVEPVDKALPTDASLPVANSVLFSMKIAKNPAGNLVSRLEEIVKKVILASMVNINSTCAEPNEIVVEIVSQDVDETVAGEYNIEVKITDSLGFVLEGGNRNYKVQVQEGLPDGIQNFLVVEGKKLYLTHYDAFDSLTVLKENWDIGNPGYGYDGEGKGIDYDQYKADSGNEGIPMPTLVTFPEGIKGYSGDRYKQPYWSPKAVAITSEGQLEISAFWDPEINNPDGNIPQGVTGAPKGYGLAGAIHSKRQFPSGFFITKIRHSTGKRAVHWDAFWAESNNPFSRAYGSKELFMPPGGESRQRRGKVYTNGMVDNIADRGLNGEQVYEFDMYEWVSNNNTQWQVIHAWSWYGGYPGNENRGIGGDVQLWSTSDNLRANDKSGMRGCFSNSYHDGGVAASGSWFYLAMLVTPDTIIMWNAPVRSTFEDSIKQPSAKKSQMTKQSGAFGNDKMNNIWPADEWAPIQVKYSMELGDWGNNHHMIYNIRDEILYSNRDCMYAEFFAFYAWDTDKYPHL